ncbi:hypothetical protein HK096_006796 [Nowakowskiella sp. JEL0078]|nr:hypothetical protein HK096_006796 [Nowakowskiella sp. JEL0078]
MIEDNAVIEEVMRNVFVVAFFNVRKLFLEFKVSVEDAHKKILYEAISKNMNFIDEFHELGFIRMRALPFPLKVRNLRDMELKIDYEEIIGFYDYSDEPKSDRNLDVITFYVSFADRSMFGYFHKDGLKLASEDVRALEMPIVGSLRDCLLSIYNNDPKKPWERVLGHFKTNEKTNELPQSEHVQPTIDTERPVNNQFGPYTSDTAGRPTPIILMGVPYQAKLNTRQIYGKIPSGLDKNIFTSKEIFEPKSSFTNLIAIEALDQKRNPIARQGCYTVHQLRTILRTTMTAFASARAAIQPKDNGSWPDLVIHTGLWGCGVYKNNPGISCLIQYAAAHFVGVVSGKNGPKPAITKLYFHLDPLLNVAKQRGLTLETLQRADLSEKEEKNFRKVLIEIGQFHEGLRLFDEAWEASANKDENRQILPEEFLREIQKRLSEHKHKYFNLHWLPEED